MIGVPAWPRSLGLAGLLPQLACLAVLIAGPVEWRYAALGIAWGYAALILSFLGGMWWGLAAAALARGVRVGGWRWVSAVAPSLIALASYLPWIFAGEWPGPSLVVLGVALFGSLFVDRAVVAEGQAPDWWMRLRISLSVGLGGATLVIGLLA